MRRWRQRAAGERRSLSAPGSGPLADFGGGLLEPVGSAMEYRRCSAAKESPVRYAIIIERLSRISLASARGELIPCPDRFGVVR